METGERTKVLLIQVMEDGNRIRQRVEKEERVVSLFVWLIGILLIKIAGRCGTHSRMERVPAVDRER